MRNVIGPLSGGNGCEKNDGAVSVNRDKGA